MKFYLDEDISPRVAEIARGRCALDVVSAHEVGTLGMQDSAQLRFAESQQRCIVTRNRDDFIQETVAAFEAHDPHAGVLIVTRSIPNDHFAAIAAALCNYASRFPHGMRSYTIDFLTGALVQANFTRICTSSVAYKCQVSKCFVR